MAIKKLHGNIYYADYHDALGHRHRISLQTSKLRIAKLKYSKLIERRNALKEKIVVEMTWEHFKDRLFQFMALERAKNTIKRTHIAIRYLEEVDCPKFLHEITPPTLQKVKEYMLHKNLGKHNINRLIQCLKSIMHHAERWEFIPKQDWSGITKIKTPRGRIVFHSLEEINKILAVCPSPAWKLVVLLGVDAGLRRGEMVQLRWQDVDFENRQLYIAPAKTENHRFVPMSKDLRKALKKAKKSSKNEFVVNVGHSRGSQYFLTAFYRKIAKKAKVASFLHKLRHTFASHLVQNGVDLYRVSKLLGHSSIKMTEIYAHLTPKTLHDAIKYIPKKANID